MKKATISRAKRLCAIPMLAPWLAFFVCLLVSFSTFGFFFPNPFGQVGHDFSLTHTGLVDGAAFFWSNPFWSVPWFTPSFCGGQPFFADPQSVYYSPLQWFAFFLPPTQASFAALLFWQSVGYWGFYLFSRHALRVSRRAAIVAGALAFANTFIADRMIIGEVGYGAFALCGLILWSLCVKAQWAPRLPRHRAFDFLRRGAMVRADQLAAAHDSTLASLNEAQTRKGAARPAMPGAPIHVGFFHRLVGAAWSHSGNIFIAGLSIALMLQSGLTTLMVPAGLGILGAGAIASWRKTGAHFGVFVVRGLLACLMAILICASKVNAGLTFMGHFPRDSYSLPGFASLWDALSFPFLSMVLGSQTMFDWTAMKLVNTQWAVLPHEWAYGFGWAILGIVLFGLVGLWILDRAKNPQGQTTKASFAALNGHRVAQTAALAILLLVLFAIPGLLMWETPGWNAVLKTIPLIKSTSWPFRWICLFIPIICSFGAILWSFGEQSTRDVRVKWFFCLFGVIAVILSMSLENRDFYWDKTEQPYKPAQMDQAWQLAREGRLPAISTIQGAEIRPDGHFKMLPLERNDFMAQGTSYLQCYNPAYGYRLETEPIGRLQSGSIFKTLKDNRLNLKNPACLIWPDANQCGGLGDEWKTTQSAQAAAFAARHPIDFSVDNRQMIANWATKITLLLSVVFAAFWIFGDRGSQIPSPPGGGNRKRGRLAQWRRDRLARCAREIREEDRREQRASPLQRLSSNKTFGHAAVGSPTFAATTAASGAQKTAISSGASGEIHVSPADVARMKQERTQKIMLWAVVVAAAFAMCAFAFGPSLYNGFVWDDILIVNDAGYDNPALFWASLKSGFLINPTNYWRPLGLASLLVQIQQTQPAAIYHLVNMMLACGNAILAGVLGAWIIAQVRKTKVSPWAALACAGLYGLHPALHEEVYWISSRFDLMANFFFFSALVVWIVAQSALNARHEILSSRLLAPNLSSESEKKREIRIRRAIRFAPLGFGVLVLLSCLSKDSAPLYLGCWAVLAWLFGCRPLVRQQRSFAVAGVLGVVAYLVGRSWALGAGSGAGVHWANLAPRSGGTLEAIRRAAYAVTNYMSLTFEPFSTHPLIFGPENIFALNVSVAIFVFAGLVLLALGILWARRNIIGGLLFGFFWLVIAYCLMQSFAAFTTGTLVAPRYLAFPLLFLPPAAGILALALRDKMIQSGAKNPPRLTALLLVLPVTALLAMGIVSARADAKVWNSEMSLWGFANKVTPGNSLIMANLSKAYSEAGRPDLAEKALTTWFNTQPVRCSDEPLGHNYMAVLQASGKLHESYAQSAPWIQSRCYAMGFLHNYAYLITRLGDCDLALRAIDELPGKRGITVPQDRDDAKMLRADAVAIAGYCKGPQAQQAMKDKLWPEMDARERRELDADVANHVKYLKERRAQDLRLGYVKEGEKVKPQF